MVRLRLFVEVMVIVVGFSTFHAFWAQEALPREHPGGDTERLVVRVRDLAEATKDLDISKPAFLLDGRQPQSLTQLREWLWAFAAPRRFPDPTVAKDSGRVGSRRIVRIEADPLADAAWVLALLQLASRVRGNDWDSELLASPWVSRFELQLVGNNEPVAFRLRTHGESPPVAVKHFHLVTTVAERFRNVPSEERVVTLFPGGEPAYGEVRGLAPLSLAPARFVPTLEPRQTFLRLRAHLAAAHARGEAVCLQVDGRTPASVLHEILVALVAEGHREIGFEGTSESLMAELEAGKYTSKQRSAPLAYTPPAVESGPIVFGEIEDPSKSIESEDPSHVIESEEPAVTSRQASRGLGKDPISWNPPREQNVLGVADGVLRPTSPAVDAGLEWLIDAQRMDGGWSSDVGLTGAHARSASENEIGVTALALLALMGAGHTDEAGPNKIAVRDGLEWLKARQDRDGAFGSAATSGFMYGQAIATLVFCQAYGSTRSPSWNRVANNGVRFIESVRAPYGAWSYGVRSGVDDLTVTRWMLTTLAAARAVDIPVDVRAIKEGQRFIEGTAAKATGGTPSAQSGELPERTEGGLATHSASESSSVAAMALLVKLLSGESPTNVESIKEAAQLICQRVPMPETGIDGRDHVYRYFGTLAAHNQGGDTWKEWQAGLRSTAAPRQRSDGAWPAVGAFASFGGEVCTTALMSLAIEIATRLERAALPR